MYLGIKYDHRFILVKINAFFHESQDPESLRNAYCKVSHILPRLFDLSHPRKNNKIKRRTFFKVGSQKYKATGRDVGESRDLGGGEGRGGRA